MQSPDRQLKYQALFALTLLLAFTLVGGSYVAADRSLVKEPLGQQQVVQKQETDSSHHDVVLSIATKHSQPVF